MKTLIVSCLAASLFATSAHAQLGDLLKNSDKILKGARVAKAATSDFTAEQEFEIGKVVAGKVLGNFPLSKNTRLQEYVSLIGHTIAAYGERADQDWHFAVIESDAVNAFSTPGNFVFVSTGMIREMKSEAELANVLAHEIVHVEKKHVLAEVKKGNTFAAGVEAFSDGRGGLSNEVGKKVAQIAWNKLFEKGLARGDELESDALGAALASKAGYASNGMVSFLGTLDKLQTASSSKMASMTKTHPSPKDRIKLVQPKASADGAVLDARFKQYTASK